MRCARFDLDVPDPPVRHVPGELGLELMAAVGADRVNPEREPLDHVVDELDGAGLVVPRIDLQGLTRVASSMAVYWNLRTAAPSDRLRERNFTSTWMW